MIYSSWGWFTEAFGGVLLIFVVAIILFIGYFVGHPSKLKEELNQFKREAIERGFASYKVDSKGVVTFEWNK